MAKEHVKAALLEARSALDALIEADQTQEAIVRASELMVEAIRSGGKILSCGNGGSLCDAMHFAEEMTGRFRSDRPGYAAGQKGDVLLAITTSGTSGNVLDAVEAAHEKGMKVIGLTGKVDSPLAQRADVAIVTPAGRWADRVQELHIKTIHIMIELVERQLAPQNYI